MAVLPRAGRPGPQRSVFVVTAYHLVWTVWGDRFTCLSDLRVSPGSESSWETETEKLCANSAGVEDSAVPHASGTTPPRKGSQVCAQACVCGGGQFVNEERLEVKDTWRPVCSAFLPSS